MGKTVLHYLLLGHMNNDFLSGTKYEYYAPKIQLVI